MKYKVIEDFKDLQDNDKVYHEGEPFPKPANKKVSKKRIDELLSKENKLRTPVIKEIKEDKE